MTALHTAPDDLLKDILPSAQCLIIGADETGRYLYKRIQKERPDVTVSGWIDKKYEFFIRCALPVIRPQDIPATVADTVVIAGRGGAAYADRLVEEYGLDRRKCVYYYVSDVETAFDDFIYPNIRYTDEAVSDEELEHVAPVSLLTDRCLDIVIRYIACKEILDGASGPGMELYRILTMSMNQGEEYTRPFTRCAYFSAYESKKGFDAFQSGFERLIDSMRRNGFDKKHFIPLTEKREIINGAHRTAAALALHENIYGKVYCGFGDRFLSFSTDDLRRIGYTGDQISYIWNSYQTIKGEHFK